MTNVAKQNGGSKLKPGTSLDVDQNSDTAALLRLLQRMKRMYAAEQIKQSGYASDARGAGEFGRAIGGAMLSQDMTTGPVGPVRNALDEQQAIFGALREMVDRLASQLRPVLDNREANKNESQPAPEPSATCDLELTIRAANDEAKSLARRLGMLADRIRL